MSLALPISDELLDTIADRIEKRLSERRRWADIEGVADYLGCPVSRVRHLRERGLPARRLPDKARRASPEAEANRAREPGSPNEAWSSPMTCPDKDYRRDNGKKRRPSHARSEPCRPREWSALM